MKISLIVPCYNEELNIQKGVLDKIGAFTKANSRFIEVLIVDDGSTDSSKQIIKEKYLGKFTKFKLIENSHQGKAASVIAGIKKAKGDYVMFIDIDLATPIEESEKLISEVSAQTPIVIGKRTSSREGAPILRKIMALGFIFTRDFFVNLGGIKDTQCGFKLFERPTALKILNKLKVFKTIRKVEGSSVSAGFDLEFLYLATKLGFKVKEVPVIWRHVETKNVNFLRDSMETMRDILKIRSLANKGKYDIEN